METKMITNYNQIRSEAEKPEKYREKLVKTNRGNIRKPRRYHMDDNKAKEMRAKFQKTGIFQNPYRKGGLYHGFVQSLISLGIDKEHDFSSVKHEMEKLLSSEVNVKNKNLWDVFANRKSRNSLSGKDINGRIIENATILQRLNGLHPFGEKLRQLNACVDILKDTSGLPKFMLNTKFSQYNKVNPKNAIKKHKST